MDYGELFAKWQAQGILQSGQKPDSKETTLLNKYPDQPRKPKGGPGGGEYDFGGIGHKPTSLKHRKPHLKHAPDKKSQNRAKAIYGETSGLTPVLKNPKASSYDSRNWDQESFAQLQKARAFIGIVSDRNSYVNYDYPSDPDNSIQANTWNHAMDAAITGSNSSLLDPNVTHFFIRQEGAGRQAPPWPEMSLHSSFGPFTNIGGGDVPKGTKTFIDFYRKKPK